MLTYFLVPALALLPTWLRRVSKTRDLHEETQEIDRWSYSYVVSVALLALYAGARVNVGTDYSLYESLFLQFDPRYIGYFLETSPQEPGFTLGVLGLKLLSEDPIILFLVSSSITVVCAAVAMRRLSVNFAVSLTLFVLLGFYLAPFNILRQGLAVSLNFLAYSYMGKRRWVWVLLNALAISVHSSAIIAVLLQVGLRRAKPTWQLFGLMLLVTAVLAAYFATVATNLGFLEFINERYVVYLEGQESGIGTYLYLLSRALLVALLVLYRPKDGSIDRYITLSMVGVCLLLLGTQAEAIGRLELYFGIFLVVALPRVAREIPRRARLLVWGAVLVGSLAFYVAYLTQFGDLVPYQFDWALLGLPSGGGPDEDVGRWLGTELQEASASAHLAREDGRSGP